MGDIVVKGKALELHPLVTPFNMVAKWQTQTRLRLLLQARSVEADAQSLRVEISWDGNWADGDVEMANHLVVKELR